jgi:hypothetical protein
MANGDAIGIDSLPMYNTKPDPTLGSIFHQGTRQRLCHPGRRDSMSPATLLHGEMRVAEHRCAFESHA